VRRPEPLRTYCLTEGDTEDFAPARGSYQIPFLQGEAALKHGCGKQVSREVDSPVTRVSIVGEFQPLLIVDVELAVTQHEKVDGHNPASTRTMS
jgi:hypothetical protein